MRYLNIFFIPLFFSFFFIVKSNAEDRIEDIFLHIESEPFTAVLVEKQSQRLWLYKRDGEGRIFPAYDFPCSTGEASGDKQLSGDRKTPEGVYFFLTEFKERYLSPIYGSGAFPMDYPNFMDLRAGKTGSAIWLHGTNKALKNQDTNGCIALENSNLDAIKKEIGLLRSPIVVLDSFKTAVGDKTFDSEKVLDMLKLWALALSEKSYQDYLVFYDKNFLPEIDWWSEWIKYRSVFSAKDPGFSIIPEQVDIFRFDNRLTIIFKLVAHMDKFKQDLGTRLLYIEENSSSGPLITGESWLSHPLSSELGKPFLAELKKLNERVAGDKPTIMAMLEEWLSAWSSKDIEAYGAFYAEGFTSQGRDRRSWLRYKDKLNSEYSYIKVGYKGEPSIKVKAKNRAEVRFMQYYDSSGFETRGRKRLELIREGGQWKIYKEIWEG